MIQGGQILTHRARVDLWINPITMFSGLNTVLVTCVMAHICTAPNFYQTIGAPDIHKAGLKRFPFHVIYRTEQNQIVVLAVAHQRR